MCWISNSPPIMAAMIETRERERKSDLLLWKGSIFDERLIRVDEEEILCLDVQVGKISVRLEFYSENGREFHQREYIYIKGTTCRDFVSQLHYLCPLPLARPLISPYNLVAPLRINNPRRA